LIIQESTMQTGTANSKYCKTLSETECTLTSDIKPVQWKQCNARIFVTYIVPWSRYNLQCLLWTHLWCGLHMD